MAFLWRSFKKGFSEKKEKFYAKTLNLQNYKIYVPDEQMTWVYGHSEEFFSELEYWVVGPGSRNSEFCYYIDHDRQEIHLWPVWLGGGLGRNDFNDYRKKEQCVKDAAAISAAIESHTSQDLGRAEARPTQKRY